VEDLNALDGARRRQFLADMAAVGDAVLACTGALRINYAMLGNMEPALHAHVIPRLRDEPQETRQTHPWAVDWNHAPPYSAAVHGELKECIARYLRGH
jgi:diadenosine tetraphosphate (Ap4A) HIT family hydrolase